MGKQINIKHKIQLHIMTVLKHQKHARFRDMRPDKCDTNLYSYHLKTLQRDGYVIKTDMGYTLGVQGLVYVDSDHMKSIGAQTQPKIVTMLVVQNSDGSVLLSKRREQPFIGEWTLPSSRLNIGDAPIKAAIKRITFETMGVEGVEPRHAGDCYVRITNSGAVIMGMLVHVFRFEADDIVPSDERMWARPHKLHQYNLAPAVEEIVTRAFFNDPHFFEEYAIELAT